ncbi:hypothetical protein SUGI_0014140 [Cryptomeria japonica]|uniref:germin-like protein 5-1 n=1 Tax=Cryptomeria japonica TaxID=3369 RepID=UPI002408E309|nr:germin-like protein 5-1 [Cryptomeria japonica]GLJ05224.1 hypothetical protein SUGI_0014140 [Cryptomeria japonica]
MASLTLLACVLFILLPVIRSDPDALQDYCVADNAASSTGMNGIPCLNPAEVHAEHFKTSILGIAGNTSGTGLAATPITPQSMPGINTLGLTMIRFDIAPKGLIPPHSHPRASEMVFVLRGHLSVGFVDTNGKFLSTKITPGDAFIFPRGTLHYLKNIGKVPVVLIGSFNSQNPGTNLVSLALFASTPPISDNILAQAFQIDVGQVEKIRKSFGG